MSESRWLMSRKQKYRRSFSKETSKKLLDELKKMETPKQPRSPMIRSSCYVSEELVKKPYQNKDIEILADTTGDHIWIYDHVHGICHSFTRDISHFHSSDGSILPIYKQLKEKLTSHLNEVTKQYQEQEAEVPDLELIDGDLRFNCSDGAFFDADNTATIEDFIPCILTPNEVVISAKAVEQIGNGNARNGGQALMMLNTIARAVHG